MKLKVTQGTDFIEVEGDAGFCVHAVQVFRMARAQYYLRQRAAARERRIQRALRQLQQDAPYLLLRRKRG